MKQASQDPSHRQPSPRPLAEPGRILIGLGLLALAGLAGSRAAERATAPDPVGTPPVGSIIAFAGALSDPAESDSWLPCDGRELTVAAFPKLHAAIGEAWGGGAAGTTFRLPDLRGRFLRGVNGEAAGDWRDPDAEARMTSAPGGNAGNQVGSIQEDATGPHSHILAGVADATGPGSGAEWIRFRAAKVPDESAPVLTNTWAIQPAGGSETRPRNVYVHWLIRAR